MVVINPCIKQVQHVQVAIDEARKTIHNIHGLEITDLTAIVNPNTGKITEYRATVKVSFAVEH
jgi:dodecin